MDHSRLCSAACISCPSIGRSMAPMQASIRSITRRPILGLAHGKMCARWQQGRDLMADLIVNHISSRSPQFEDFRRSGDLPLTRDLFLTYGRVFPKGALGERTCSRFIVRAPACRLPRSDWMTARNVCCGPLSPPSRSISMSARPRDAAYLEQILRRVSSLGNSGDPPGCRGIRDQEAGHQLLHDPGDVRLHRGAHGSGARSWESKCWWRFTRTTRIRSTSRGMSTGFMTSLCRRWCCTLCTRANCGAPETLAQHQPPELRHGARHTRRNRRHRRGTGSERRRHPAGIVDFGGDRHSGRNDSRAKQGREPPGDRSRREQSGPVSGQLHLL